MGCCQTSLNKGFESYIKDIIDLNSDKKLKITLKIMKKNKDFDYFINKEIVNIQRYSFNCIAYCVYKGNSKLFKVFLGQGISLEETERRMNVQGLCLINLICFKGYLELLKEYLGLHLGTWDRTESDCSQSFYSELNRMENLWNFDLPIHSACKAGKVNIVAFLVEYFKDFKCVPKEFSVYSVNDRHGEDSGLISCRYGHFILVKFLYENCGIKFTTLNKNDENALIVCLSGLNPDKEFNYLEVISYLIEIVGLDIKYKYEELLILAQGDLIVNYLETQLKKVGINSKKSEIEESFHKLYNQHLKNSKENTESFSELDIKNSFLSSVKSPHSHNSYSICDKDLEILVKK